jgi:hypothetical protein
MAVRSVDRAALVALGGPVGQDQPAGTGAMTVLVLMHSTTIEF